VNQTPHYMANMQPKPEIKPVPRDRVVVWRAPEGWRWHYQAGGNGRVMAESGEPYGRRGDALNAMHRVLGRPLTIVRNSDSGRVLVLAVGVL
jgi:hypothetical protein